MLNMTNYNPEDIVPESFAPNTVDWDDIIPDTVRCPESAPVSEKPISVEVYVPYMTEDKILDRVQAIAYGYRYQ